VDFTLTASANYAAGAAPAGGAPAR